MRAPPHLPFLDRPTAFTVGLKPLALADWLTPDWEVEVLPEKAALLERRRADAYAASAGSADGEAEAANLVAAAVEGQTCATLADAARLVSDDLVLMEQRDGAWTATAAALCSPTYFSVADALGSSLALLHGPVPAGEGFADRIARVFSMVRPDESLERFNWTVQPTSQRFTPASAPLKALAATIAEGDALDEMHLRVERQTIRRLPRTGGVLFTIRVSLDPLRAVFAQTGAKAAFATAWRAAPEPLRAYKGWAHYERLVRAALDLSEDR